MSSVPGLAHTAEAGVEHAGGVDRLGIRRRDGGRKFTGDFTVEAEPAFGTASAERRPDVFVTTVEKCSVVGQQAS